MCKCPGCLKKTHMTVNPSNYRIVCAGCRSEFTVDFLSEWNGLLETANKIEKENDEIRNPVYPVP